MLLNAETHKWESDYWHPAVTVDAVVFGYDEDEHGLSVLLIERGLEPFKGSWALPGGFITQNDESAEAAVYRELHEETDVEGIYLKEFNTFSKVGRDPRPNERVITIAFLALVVKKDYQIKGGDDAKQAQWFPLHDLPQLAFDHQEIVAAAFERLQQIIHFEPIAFHLLNKDAFTMPQLHSIYKAILAPREEESNPVNDRRNFMKKMLALKYVRKTGEIVRGTPSRPPELYRFDEEAYWSAKKKGKRLEF